MPTVNEPLPEQEQEQPTGQPAAESVTQPAKAKPEIDVVLYADKPAKAKLQHLTQDELMRRSLEDKVLHLNEEMEMLKTMPSKDAKEGIRRAAITLSNVNKTLAALVAKMEKEAPKESPKT